LPTTNRTSLIVLSFQATADAAGDRMPRRIASGLLDQDGTGVEQIEALTLCVLLGL